MPKARFSVLESAQRIKVAYLQPRTIVANLGLAAVYFGVAKFGLSMAVTAEQVSTVWPPTGVALAAILVFGYRVWPGIWLGAFLANATANEPISVACGIAVGNTLEAMIGVWLLGRVAFDKSLERLKDVLGLILIAAGLSTTVSAAIGVICLCLGGVHSWSEFGCCGAFGGWATPWAIWLSPRSYSPSPSASRTGRSVAVRRPQLWRWV